MDILLSYKQTNKHVKKNSDKGERVNEVIFRSNFENKWQEFGIFQHYGCLVSTKLGGDIFFSRSRFGGESRNLGWYEMTIDDFILATSISCLALKPGSHFFFKLLLVKDFLECWIRHRPAEARTKTRAQLLHEKSQVRLEKYSKKDLKMPMILRTCDVMILEISVSFMFMPIHAN